MIRFGIIGTNTITESFLTAAQNTTGFQLTTVYSRTMEKAQLFAEKYGATYTFDDLELMAKSPEIDAVYIASPNALHCEQTCLFLQHGKHVLCEKPLCSNLPEAEKMVATARQHGVLLMEAMKTPTLPNYLSLKKHLHKIGKIHYVQSHYCQYSSRYDKFKAGEIMNAFRPELSNGALMDLGVYALYPVIDLFGMPNDIKASAVMLHTGVDGMGSALLSYPDLVATVSYSKISDMKTPSEIQGEEGSILIEHISQQNSVKIVYRDGREEDITEFQSSSPMQYELAEFISTIQQGKTESALNNYTLALRVADIMQTIRQQIGLVFDADKKI
ncbi:Gfo/Idh/MocA family protein [Tolumonas lignilytica]|uniref:Gfo/Idh/MocA family protein n=1 Tax=Tolumonas lignilytica TaxID=1283284 RepID=UPI0004640E90|nr:Gfo/Idh/MocA family oxidoreductase [Tolumonas lignilytica]